MVLRRCAAILPIVLAALVAPAAAQEPDAQAPPVFRAGVDVIELDVTVLDASRRPVRGLTVDDFTVLEDGRPQRVVAVSHVDLADYDPARSARMRYVTRDVAANDLSDQLGDGRLVAIVFDDVNVPADDPEIVRAARETARAIVDRLGPSDMAAVIYAQNAGRTQDFTSDRRRLLEAIDRFQPSGLDWFGTPQSTGLAGGGDLAQPWRPMLARSPCMRAEPAVPTLDTVTSRLATAPGRRKAVMFISVGVAVSLSATDACGSQLADVIKDVFRTAQRANINIYPIDPSGVGGYEQYLRLRAARRGQEPPMPGRRQAPRNLRGMQDFMRVLADQTGGRAVINTEAREIAIEQILAEDRDYYLVGYEPENRVADGGFRRVEVRVNRPGVSVRSRSGYWAPVEGDVLDTRLVGAPSSTDSALAGLTHVQGVPLRVTLGPVAPSAQTRSAMDAVAVLSVRYPALAASVTDTLTITRHVYDDEGRAGAPEQMVESVVLQPRGGEETRHDILQVLTLSPGRHQVRFHVQSQLLKTTGTVYADIEVPNIARSPLALSGLFLAGPQPDAGVTGDADGLLPIVPTSRREFGRNETIHGFARVYQAAAGPRPVGVRVEVVDAGDQVRHEQELVFDPAQLEADGGAEVRFEIPLERLSPGPHLLSVTARLPGGRTARRDVLLGIR